MGRLIIATALVVCVGCGWGGGGGAPAQRVVLYCAQDQEFAEGVLDDFNKRSDLKVAPRFDTEAQKSVAFYEEIVREADRPRCDVWWNNEILGTIRMQKKGLLEPYRSPSAEPYPDFAKSKDGSWTAFAARARVLIVNTNLVPENERPKSLFDLTDPKWKGKAAMGKPAFGTTATHAACLFEVLGPDKAKEFYRGLRDNEIHVTPGNKHVAQKVAEGVYAVGMTDTDDAIIEIKAGKPVVMIFPDGDRPKDDRMGTLFLPNTLAIVKGCPNPEGAKKLVDFLLSEEVEGKLARAAGQQIPLNPKVRERPHEQIQTPATVKAMDVDFEKAAELWDEVQTFLRNEFARP